MPRSSTTAFRTFVLCLFICPLFSLPFASASLTASSSTQFSVPLEADTSTAYTVPGYQHRGSAIMETHEMLPTEHLILDYRDRLAANSTNALLTYLDGDRGEPCRETVRTCTVEGFGSIANWTLALSAISKIHHLEEIHWLSNALIPAALLRGLESSHPSCRLYYDIPFENWDPYDPGVPPIQVVGEEHAHEARARERLSILNSTVLYALKGKIGYGEDHNPEDLSLVNNILTSCPNVRELELSIEWAGGCRVGDEQPYGFDFSPSSGMGNKTMVPLEVLRLNGYLFESRLNGYRWREWQSSYPGRHLLRWLWKYLPDLAIRSFGFNYLHWIGGTTEEFVKGGEVPLSDRAKTNLDGWLERMDWSNLHTLQLDSASPEVIEKLKPVLVSLKSFTVDYGNTCSARSYLDLLWNTARPLESIHLHNVKFDSLDAVIDMLGSRHSDSLTSFVLQEWDGFREVWDSSRPRYYTYQPHAYLLPRHLQQLRDQCPNISSLDIDLNRTSLDTVDQAILDVIPTFANLPWLTLRLESPDIQSFRWDSNRTYREWMQISVGPDRIVDQTMVSALFSTIRQQQGLQRHVLLHGLEIFVGNWREHYSRGRVDVPRHLVGHWQCSIDAQGQEVCHGRNKLESDREHEIFEWASQESDDEEEESAEQDDEL